MKKLLLLSLLFLTGCNTTVMAHKQFYVKSGYQGYSVAVDESATTTIYVSRPFQDPLDAEILTKKLNRDMEGNWER